MAATFQIDITANTALTSPVVIPPGFTQVTYGIGNGATLTLAPGSDPTSTFFVRALSGGGQIANNTAITTTGPAIANDGFNFSSTLSVTNNGTIQSAVSSGQYAVTTGNFGLFNLVNTGSITSTGAGGAVNAGANLTFTNSGSVIADGTAVNAFDNVLTNSGTITSRNGVGFFGLGNVGTPSSNSGTISGLTLGAELNGYFLTNTGTISSAGLAVSIDSTGKLINAPTGRVIGDIGTLNGNGARLDNAGIINGNVNFGASFGSGNVVTLRPGSVITGNIVLGIGNDTLVTSLVNTGPGQFAGVNGTVTGGGAGTDILRYLVSADANISALGVPGLFGDVIYDLANNAKLTLTPGNIPYSKLGLVGVGTVDLTANIVAAGGSPILDLTRASVQGTGTVLTALDVTSRGTLTGVRNTIFSWQPLVLLSNPTKFTNAGTIVAQDATPDPNIRLVAVQGNGTVINSGTMNLLNADGIDLATGGGSLSVTNSGTITGVAGDISSRGISRATAIVNTGVISTGGWAVLSSAGPAALSNSGQLRSARDAAVLLFGSSGVTNQAGGIISGWTYGISVTSGSPNITNAGSISGGIYSIFASGGSAVTLTLQTGSSLGGDVFGAAGANNSLVLQGAGTEDSSFLNFRSLNMQGPGNWTLSGTSSIAASTVSGGTLNVTGAIAGGTVSVANGGTLSGTGKVGATTVASGGTLNPGSSTTPGTLSVTGNLTLVAGASYLDAITPTTAGLTSVSGAASINGNVIVVPASGAYTTGQRYTLLTALGGVSGTFTAVTGLPFTVRGQLNYDANNVYLTLGPNTLAPQLSNATGNQHNIVSAIDAAVLAGNVPPAGFAPLYSLSGPALNNALDQISGQVGPNVSNAVGQGFLSFLSMTADGGGVDVGSYAQDSAYGTADAPHRAQLGTGETRVWGAVYGGHVGLSGDSASGTAGLTSNNVGLIGGADRKFTDNILAGVTLGLGQQLFHSGNGTGGSHDVMIGVYGRIDADAVYVAASLGFGWHHIKTQRTVMVSGIDVLQGKQDADDVGGRMEAGWRLPLDATTKLIPYGAFVGDSINAPAYTESVVSGASTFVLAYGAQTTTLGRTELGAHLDRSYSTEHGLLTADVRLAWAHQLDDLPFSQASFVNLPAAAFQAVGVRAAGDAALLGLDVEMQSSSGLFFGLKGESQLGAGTTMVEGLGNFGWRW